MSDPTDRAGSRRRTDPLAGIRRNRVRAIDVAHDALSCVEAYLATSAAIDHAHPSIVALAKRLRGPDPVGTALRSFERVRDRIRHSGDHRLGPTTWRASDVLREGHGFCFAKSHLLAALLRANGIPAGLCYQRLSVGGGAFSLHGLVAAHLPGFGWYRMDPRGNRPGVEAQFAPPVERLAFTIGEPGEWDDATVYARPWPEIVSCLTSRATWQEVLADLPDRAAPPGAALRPSVLCHGE